MMDTCFLSIIIPVYNGELYLRETIRSILQQPCKDFELILLNDGSNDCSLDICKEYESDLVRVYSHENMGVSRTRNKGISLAKGQAFIFLDQDDAMRSNFYTEVMRNRMLSFIKDGVELFVTGAWNCDGALKRGSFMSIEKKKKGLFEGHSDELSWGNMYTFNMNIFSRTLFYDKDNNPTSVRFFDLPLDVETIFRHITLYAARKIYFSDDFNFCIRRNNVESVSSNWNWNKVYQVKIPAYYDLINWHKKNYVTDSKAIEGAEKTLLRVVEEGIHIANGTSFFNEFNSFLRDLSFYEKLIELIDKYPKDALLLRQFLVNPKEIFNIKKKKYKVVTSFLWKIYGYFCKMNEVNIRKEVLKI